MSQKVLLAAPDPQWLLETKNFLEKEKGYQVDICNKGTVAQKAIHAYQYKAIFLSLEIENHPGIQVLNFIKTNHPGLKVILGSKDINEHFENADDALEAFSTMGINEIHPYPIGSDELVAAIEAEHIVQTDIVEEVEVDEESGSIEKDDREFTSVRIGEFIASRQAIYNIFIKVRDGKYLMLFKAGDDFDKERIESYKAKGVTHLYILNKDRQAYIKHNRAILKKLMENKKVPTKVKMDMTKNVTEKFVEELYTEGLKPHVLEQGMQVADDMYTLINEDKDIHTLLREYKDFDPSAYNHAFLVSLFANMVIKQFEWESRITTQTVGMACMVLDMGKLKLPKEIIDKKEKEMTPEEFELYKKHVDYGLEVLKDVPLIKPAIKEIMHQHHERLDGSGYPQGLQGPRIFTLAKIVGLADDFACYVQEHEKAPLEAFQTFAKDETILKKHHATLIQQLGKVFMDPDKAGPKMKRQQI